MKQIIISCIILLCIGSIISESPIIDVYIESLCPDCMEYIQNSFAEFFKNPNHADLAVVNFYPFGNASQKFNEKTQRWEFTCQHKERECEGNIIETCTLSKLSREDGHKFLICFENYLYHTKINFEEALNFCFADKEFIQNVLACSKSEEGNQLQHKVADKTPSHQYVPWIHINGVHNEQIEASLLEDMVTYLCSLGDNNKLPGCADLSPKKLLSSLRNKQCLNEFYQYKETLEYLY